MTDIQAAHIKIVDKVANRFYRRCRNPQDYEDLLQQARLIYVQEIGNFRLVKGNIRSFLNVVIYKKLLNYYDSLQVRNEENLYYFDEMPTLSGNLGGINPDMTKALSKLNGELLVVLNNATRNTGLRTRRKKCKTKRHLENLKKIENILNAAV